MKTRYITTIAAIACFCLATTSCKPKEYTCECKGGLTGQYNTEETITATTDASAKAKCKNLGTPVGTPDGINCDLK
ncbi:MAG: hypothetical protein H6551_07625 [Chitinophagales bacterium]|nr:hypothetical protein [Chitinophagaceae bacterium]MCB9064999.1 hypothetical protein [Chitinophagales bacterium]